MALHFVRAEPVPMRGDPNLSEKWVQELIAADPAILGLGDLVLRDKERAQPRAGRLDLLLQHPETKRRYEVELQLGSTDEAHIIRTIEYWDVERKRYPQYDHCAVLVAENVTSRFLNVMALFNGTLPLIAIQMQALRVGQSTTLVFTTVLGELTRGPVDDDEEADAAPADAKYWNARTSPGIMKVVDRVAAAVKDVYPYLELNYNRYYAGWKKDKQPFNFMRFRPKKKWVEVGFKLDKTVEHDSLFEKAGGDPAEYEPRWGAYLLRLTSDENINPDHMTQLLKAAYDDRAR